VNPDIDIHHMFVAATAFRHSLHTWADAFDSQTACPFAAPAANHYRIAGVDLEFYPSWSASHITRQFLLASGMVVVLEGDLGWLHTFPEDVVRELFGWIGMTRTQWNGSRQVAAA
jgi:hypothetical protein